MRNPLARLVQRDPAKPSLRARMAATKVRAKRILGGDRASSAAVAQPDPHLAYLAPLLQAHAERHAARPIDNITHCPKEEAASLRVSQRLWRLQDAVLHLPAPEDACRSLSPLHGLCSVPGSGTAAGRERG